MNPQELKTIVIVDDELEAREALGEFLKRNGYVVAFAGNGQAALDQISTLQAPPALILLDLMMPVMDGLLSSIEHERIGVPKTFPSSSQQGCRHGVRREPRQS
jgi:DNA-binding response OmpR family regulator